MSDSLMLATARNLDDAQLTLTDASGQLRAAEKLERHYTRRIEDLNSLLDGALATIEADRERITKLSDDNARLRGEADLLEQADALDTLADERTGF